MHTQIAQLAYLMLKQKKKRETTMPCRSCDQSSHYLGDSAGTILPFIIKIQWKFTIYTKSAKALKKNQCRDMVAYHQNQWTNAEKTCDLWWQWQKISHLVSRIHACFWPSHGKNRACVDVSWLRGRMYSEINNQECVKWKKLNFLDRYNQLEGGCEKCMTF